MAAYRDTFRVNSFPVVMYVVLPDEFNSVDQRWVAQQLWEAHGVGVLRRTLAQLGSEASLGAEGQLLVGGQEVAVVYYRAGYSPEQHDDRAWATRLLLERSRAVKTPTVGYQLAGAKKVQQELA